ncbi:protein kinase domain-containing protein [Trichonephila inaurata madagascariensis]|uniref:Protein kinase domain-containing protein n=1 Tax=Trichonephila inaurata madagascariensis TaxID=2747483 RepID=A0A8X6XMG2_9ARAC|nr:protein kinase domain-containing protein [Trichonephila inaurata madagascariensis]
MEKSIFKASEIRYLWKYRGSKDYELKCLKARGNSITTIIFEDIRNGREVCGKLVTSPREGEAYHWPRLQHENLAPLLEVISINEKVSMYMTVIFEKSLRDIIHEEEFLRTPNCFERKKSYVEDILWGLDYLHNKHLCLMNLSEANIYIYAQTDKAVITDFSSLTLSQRAEKRNVAVIPLYRAPEIYNESSEWFDAISAEMWACGVMILQIFTGHALPEVGSNYDIFKYLLSYVADLHLDVLVQANIGALVSLNIFILFKKFLDLFLEVDPVKRCSAKIAAVSDFLQRPLSEFSEGFGKLWQYYSPQTGHFPERKIRGSHSSIEFDNQNKLNDASKASVSCLAFNDAANYKERLKNHVPWNKFINLEYVSKEQNVDYSPYKWNYKQAYHNISDNYETAELGEKQANNMDLNNVYTNNQTSEVKTTAFQPFESIYSTCETSINNSYSKPGTELKELNGPNYTDSISEPIPIRHFTLSKSDDKLQSIVDSKIHAQEDICEEKKREDLVSSIISGENPNVIYNFLDSSNKFPLSSNVSPTIPMKKFRKKWNIQPNSNNLLTNNEKSDITDIKEICSYERNSEKSEMYNLRSKNSWMKDSKDNLKYSVFDNNEKDSSLPDFSNVNKFRHNFYKSYIREIPRSHSDFSINLLSSCTFLSKSFPCVSRLHLHLLDQYRYCHLTLSSVDIRIPVKNSRGNTFRKTDSPSKHEINENELGNDSSFFTCSSSFLDSDSNQNRLYHADNSKIKDYITDNLSTLLKNLSLVSQGPLIDHHLSLDNGNFKLSKSETSLELQKPMILRNCRSEIFLDQKFTVLDNTTPLTSEIKFRNGTHFNITSKSISDVENFSSCLSGNALNKIGLGNINTESTNFEKNKVFFNKRHSYTCAMMHSFDFTENKCVTDRYFSNERICNSKQSIKNPVFSNFILRPQRKSNDKKEKLHHDKQSIKNKHDVSAKWEDIEDDFKHSNEYSPKKSEYHGNEAIETKAECSSFTDIPLRSIEIPQFVNENSKSKKGTKKSARRKSWFRRLCPGCKVYYDDKEELFADIT